MFQYVGGWHTRHILGAIVQPQHASLYPCTGDGGLGVPGPLFWRCGADNEMICSTKNGTRFRMNLGLGVKILGIDDPSTATQTQTVTVTTQPSLGSSTPSSEAQDTDPSNTSASQLSKITSEADEKTCSDAALGGTCPKKATVPVGVEIGVPLIVLAIAMLGLFLNERRKRKKAEHVYAPFVRDSSITATSLETPHSLWGVGSKAGMSVPVPTHELWDRRKDPREIGSSR
ncbi:hypothetical protein B0O99DRAFT_617240 [Bisporella sp. PMI_857]|nr:hypothetical protein B0O99DRAFT_617240 [Bisporella sp. PMI_857]